MDHIVQHICDFYPAKVHSVNSAGLARTTCANYFTVKLKLSLLCPEFETSWVKSSHEYSFSSWVSNLNYSKQAADGGCMDRVESGELYFKLMYKTIEWLWCNILVTDQPQSNVTGKWCIPMTGIQISLSLVIVTPVTGNYAGLSLVFCEITNDGPIYSPVTGNVLQPSADIYQWRA
jgi:hypothetical protein